MENNETKPIPEEKGVSEETKKEIEASREKHLSAIANQNIITKDESDNP